MQRLWTWIALVLITALGAWLRWRGVVDLPPWYDELHTEWVARSTSLGELLRFEQSDPKHMPLGFLIAKLSLWLGPETAPFGEDAVRLCRWPSWALSVTCIPLGYALGRTIAPGRLGIWIALLIAVDPLQVDQGQTARMYSAWTSLLLATLVVAPRLFSAPSPTRSLMIGGLLGLGFCTHPLAAAAWVALVGVTALELLRPNSSKSRLAQCVVLALTVGALLAGRGMWRLWTLSDTQRPDVVGSWTTNVYEAIQTIAELMPPLPVAWIAVPAVGWTVLRDFVRPTPRDRHYATPAPTARISMWLLGITAAAGFVLLIPLRDRHWFLAPRYAIAIQPAIWSGLAAISLTVSRRTLARGDLLSWVRAVFLLGAVGLMSWSSTHLHDVWQWPDKHRVTEATHLVRANIEPGERVAFAPGWLHLMGSIQQLPIDLELQGRLAERFPPNPWAPVPQQPPEPTAATTGKWLVISCLPETRDPQRITAAVAAIAQSFGAPFDPSEFSARLRPRSLHLVRIRSTGVELRALAPFGSAPSGSTPLGSAGPPSSGWSDGR